MMSIFYEAVIYLSEVRLKKQIVWGKNKMLKLYWHCATKHKCDEEFVQRSLQELTTYLEKPPTEIRMSYEKLDLEKAITIVRILETELLNNNKTVENSFEDAQKKILKSGTLPVLIYCDPYSPIAKSIKQKQPRAEWGLYHEQISTVYRKGNKYILWHEALHLFDVDDCYDINNRNGPLKCELENCLMRYAPQQGKVARWPFLCKENIKLLKNYE